MDMKKLIILIIIPFLILFSLADTVFAEEYVNFYLTDENNQLNRLVTIEMKAESFKKLSAASFEFTYDNNMLEYREIKVTDDSSQIKVNDTDGKIKLIFLNTFGKDISDKESIFTITFKSIKEGTSYIDFTVNDCVDEDVQSLHIGNCKSATINISKKHNTSTGNKPQSRIDKNNTSNNSERGKSTRSSQSQNDIISTADEWGSLNPIDDKNIRFLFIGAGAGIALVCVAVLAFYIGRKSLEKSHEKKNNGDNN